MKFFLTSVSSFCILGIAGILSPANAKPISTWYDYEGVELRALDKTTARSTTFKAKVGQTLRFGEIFVKIRACRKPPAVEKEESATFIQVWEKDKEQDESQWVFSGWMFASSPALSAMDHPIYDVWVLSCTGTNPEPEPEIEEEIQEELKEVDGETADEENVTPAVTEDTTSETDKLIEGLVGDEPESLR